MASRLAEDVPSDLEDVDTEFDDESNRLVQSFLFLKLNDLHFRWFAREFYAVKHECTLIKKMRDINRQRVGVVKLHRTGKSHLCLRNGECNLYLALRLVQVAASRPILRVLNPHIYGQLGDLVRDLVDLSDRLDLPLWDPEPILNALERAVYFPPRKSQSRRGSIAPSDIALMIAPQNRRSVSRKKPPKPPHQRKKRATNQPATAIYSPQKRRPSAQTVAARKSSLKSTKREMEFTIMINHQIND